MLYSRSRRRNRRRSSRRRNSAMAANLGGNMLEISDKPVSSVLPKVREIAGEVGTGVVGMLAFIANAGIGVAVDTVVSKSGQADKLGKAAGIVKFSARYLMARGTASFLFRANKGLLSKDNGRFIVNLSLITAIMGLARDFGLFTMLQEKFPQLAITVPSLAGYDSGVSRGNLSRFRRLRAYDSGIQRGNLSAYDSGVRRASLSSYTSGVRQAGLSGNFDDMPVEQQQTRSYGVPFGA